MSARPAVICVGLSTLDVIHRIPQPPRWGGKHLADHTEVVAGGPAANAAITAARLLRDRGVDVVLITALGSGSAAQLVGADLADHGVAVFDCAAADFVLPVASALITADGERTVISPGALTSDASLTDPAAARLDSARVVLLDGHHPRLAEQVLARLPARALTVLDAGSVKAHVETWLPRLDVVAGSRAYATGLRASTQDALEHVLGSGARAALITHGPNRIEYAVRSPAGVVRGSHQPTPVAALDTLGAGDAFHGALAAAILLTTSAGLRAGGEPRSDRITDRTSDDELAQLLPNATRRASDIASHRVTVPGARAWMADLPPW